jgi:putative ABC transport system permease protein
MQAINRKLVRDLWHVKGQALSISLVIAVGVVMLIMYNSAFDSLRLTQTSYYERQRFADVFATLKRAPWRLRDRIANIPGVAQVETRVVVDVTLDVEGMSEPATGRLISIPAERRQMLNDLSIQRGRYIDGTRSDEVIVNEAFALAHDLRPGDTVTAIINGRRRDLEVVGFGLSPEFIYTIRPGELIPDDTRFGVFWMERRALAAAFDMEGGFNDVTLSLMPGAREEDVIQRLDGLIESYGGFGAIPRAQQLSHWSLTQELNGLQGVGQVVPLIFLAIAAFLLNVVLTRMVTVQREQIAALKALGYANTAIGWHYTKWALAIAVTGAVIGTAGGAAMGSAMMSIYNQFFQFPELTYRLLPGVVASGFVISLLAGVLGAATAVRRAVRLPPAEAMRPQPPARYRVSLVERLGIQALLSQPARIVLRNIQRQPVRSLASVTGIAFSVAMLIAGTFSIDAMNEMMHVQFSVAQHQDVTVTFAEPASAAARHALERLPGVVSFEPTRSIPARLRFGSRTRQLAISGLPAEQRLNRVLEVTDLSPVTLPPDGLVVSRKLAEILDVGLGDIVRVEILQGARPVREVVVADVVKEYMGLSAYMEIGSLRRLLRESDTLSGGFMTVDSSQLDVLYRALKETPLVAGVTLTTAALESFEETFAENINVMIFFNVLFAGIIACGVVYNAARMSLSERSRELASLRVIGFTRAEISSILLGELATLTCIAIPIGLLVGYGLAALVVTLFDTELYSFPLAVAPRTYALSTLAVLAATALSGLIVRRKLDSLDLVEVLKTRE